MYELSNAGAGACGGAFCLLLVPRVCGCYGSGQKGEWNRICIRRHSSTFSRQAVSNGSFVRSRAFSAASVLTCYGHRPSNPKASARQRFALAARSVVCLPGSLWQGHVVCVLALGPGLLLQCSGALPLCSKEQAIRPFETVDHRALQLTSVSSNVRAPSRSSSAIRRAVWSGSDCTVHPINLGHTTPAVRANVRAYLR